MLYIISHCIKNFPDFEQGMKRTPGRGDAQRLKVVRLEGGGAPGPWRQHLRGQLCLRLEDGRREVGALLQHVDFLHHLLAEGNIVFC